MSKTLAIVFGIVFVVVGLLGFVSNPLVGMNGIFETNTLHNLVHLVIGLILLAVAIWSPMQSSLWLKIMGFVYLVIAILGFLLISGSGDLLGLVTINTADNWLHVVLAIVLLAAGYMYGSEGMAMPAKAM